MPQRINDPVFGTMTYMGDRLRYWEGRALFLVSSGSGCPSSGEEIEVFVDGLRNEQFIEQHEFFMQVCKQWPRIQKNIQYQLQRLADQNPQFTPCDLSEHFTVTSMSIPKGILEHSEWEITVRALHGDQSYAVQMKGVDPILATIDD